jgi:hypothetical protein
MFSNIVKNINGQKKNTAVQNTSINKAMVNSNLKADTMEFK